MSSHSIHRPRWAMTPIGARSSAAASRALPTATAGERVLLEADRAAAAPTVLTDLALHHRPIGGAWRRYAWIDIMATGWSLRTGLLRLRHWSADGLLTVIDMPTSQTSAALASDLVNHAHLIRQRVEITPGVIALVEAVRDAGEPRWRVHLPTGVAPDDPEIRRRCCDIVRELRSLTGC